MLTQKPKGTKDVTPEESYIWQYIEEKARNIARTFGYREIRTPVFEHTELFLRGVGDTSDVVQKEMYTFSDKAGRSITLKPEGTAGAARSYIEEGMNSLPQPVKMYYLTPVFRYENTSKGRLREHHQFGIESFGAKMPTMDAEVICLAIELLKSLGLKGLSVNLNSIGCEKCRPQYQQKLKEYLQTHYDDLCDTCKGRFEKNPMRILDCKTESCKRIVANAPVPIDYLCEECQTHMDQLKALLSAAEIPYAIDPMIVRGLDYYTKTVFEIIADIGGNITICGGGRYDNLIAELEGPPTCGVGFGMGLERLIMLLSQEDKLPAETSRCDVLVAFAGEGTAPAAFALAQKLRQCGIKTELEHNGRSFKAQFKSADRLNAAYTVVIGTRELETGIYTVKNMRESAENPVKAELVCDYIMNELKL